MKRLALFLGVALMFLPQFSAADSAACVPLTQKLQRGSRGAQVISLQTRLATNKAIYPDGSVSGYFGALTEKAVQQFQLQNGLVMGGTPASTGFGVVGPKTRTALNAVLCGGAATVQTAPAATVGWLTASDGGAAKTMRVDAQVKVKEGEHQYTVTVGTVRTTLTPTSSVCNAGECSVIISGTLQQEAGNYNAVLFVDGVKAAERAVIFGGSLLDRVADVAFTSPATSTALPYGAGLTIAWYSTKVPSTARTELSLVSESGRTHGSIGKYNGASGQFLFILPDRHSSDCSGSALDCLASLAGSCVGAFCDMEPGKYRIKAEIFDGTRSVGSAMSQAFTLLDQQGLPVSFDPLKNMTTQNNVSTDTVQYTPLPVDNTSAGGGQCMYSGVYYASGITLDVACGDYYRTSCGTTAGQTVTCKNGNWFTASGATTTLSGVTTDAGPSEGSCITPSGGLHAADKQQVPYQPYFTNGQYILSYLPPMMECRSGGWYKCDSSGSGCEPWNPVQL